MRTSRQAKYICVVCIEGGVSAGIIGRSAFALPSTVLSKSILAGSLVLPVTHSPTSTIGPVLSSGQTLFAEVDTVAAAGSVVRSAGADIM